MYLQYYQKQLGEAPSFLHKYFDCDSLKRLQKVGYFCGMDYASKDIYRFSEKISRFDHSYNVSLIGYLLTHDEKTALMGLFHDIATPAFSHVIDYMNQDYMRMESTEEYTEEILKRDKDLLKCLKEDHFELEEISQFKNNSIIDCERPGLCADRLDGIVLTGFGWVKQMSLEDISSIISHLDLYENEKGEKEIGFDSIDVCDRAVEINQKINELCQSKEDTYMMMLLASITKLGIEEKLFTYQDLYVLGEEEVFSLLKKSRNPKIFKLLKEFYSLKKEDIPDISFPYVKKRIFKMWI